MERRLRNRLRMLTATLGHFDDHPTLWADLGPVATEVEALRAAHADLVDAGDAQAANDPEGLTAQKTAARRAAAKALAVLSGKATAYAIAIGDEELREAVDHSESEWARMPDAEFPAQAKNALDRIEAHAEGLAPYRVTAEETQAARRAVAEVGRIAERRDNTAAGRAVATDDLPETYSEDAVPALGQLDRLVPVLIDDEAFVDRYREVRKIPGD